MSAEEYRWKLIRKWGKWSAMWLVLIALMLIGSPAFAAPPETEKLCFDKAARTTFWGKGEREAFMARCIADYTPPRRTKKRD